MDSSQDQHNEITFDNLLAFLESLPQEDSLLESTVTHKVKVPDDWSCIGSLADKRIKGNFVMYKPYTNYALGFYPFYGCEIYKDGQGKIILSYIELGGHFPFRSNFFVTKNSPFIIEPVSIQVAIKEEENDYFLNYLLNYGVSKEKMEGDLIKFNSVTQITIDLNIEETSIFRAKFDSYTKTYNYSIITKRENAVKIKAEFNN